MFGTFRHYVCQSQIDEIRESNMLFDNFNTYIWF